MFGGGGMKEPEGVAAGSFEVIKVANMVTAFRQHGTASGALVRPEAARPAHGGQRVVQTDMNWHSD
jgi:hypothetical protein